MRIPKKYGQSQIAKCPFCGMMSTTVNSQKIPTCIKHKESSLDNLKCACGGYLDLKHGKFGPFFTCFKCGIVNMRKALDVNSGQYNVQGVKTQTTAPVKTQTTQITQTKQPEKKPKSTLRWEDMI
jgi:hypothetical protein